MRALLLLVGLLTAAPVYAQQTGGSFRVAAWGARNEPRPPVVRASTSPARPPVVRTSVPPVVVRPAAPVTTPPIVVARPSAGRAAPPRRDAAVPSPDIAAPRPVRALPRPRVRLRAPRFEALPAVDEAWAQECVKHAHTHEIACHARPVRPESIPWGAAALLALALVEARRRRA